MPRERPLVPTDATPVMINEPPAATLWMAPERPSPEDDPEAVRHVCKHLVRHAPAIIIAEAPHAAINRLYHLLDVLGPV